VLFVDASVAIEPTDADRRPFADVALVDMMTDAIGLLDKVGDIIAANMNDCDTMAARVDEFRLQHLDGVEEVAAIYHGERKEEMKQLQPQFRARFKAAWQKVRPGIAKCTHSARMKKVIHEIWGDSDWGPPPDASDLSRE